MSQQGRLRDIPTALETLTGNTGGAVLPDGAGNIDIVGGDTTTVAGNPGTNTLTIDASTAGYPITPFVVGVSGQAGYATIQAGLDAANTAGGGMVYVQPGTFTEDLTFYDNIQLFGDSEQATVIVGTHTPPTSGNLNIFRCTFQDATAIFSSAAAGSTTIIIEDCTLSVTNGFSFDILNWTGSVAAFDIGFGGTNDGAFRNTGGASLFVFAATWGIGSGQTFIASGLVEITTSFLGCPADFQTGVSGFIATSQLNDTVTFSNNSSLDFFNCSFDTVANQAITMNSSGACSLTSCGVDSSNNPAIGGTGAGTLTLTSVAFPDNNSFAGTLTIAGGNQYSATYKSDYTNHGIILGQGAISNMVATAAGSSGIPLIGQGGAADPLFGTAIVAGGGTGAVTLTDGGILLGSGTSAITATAQPASGELLIGSVGADPVLATLTAGVGITVTNGAGTITIDSTGGGITWNEETGTSATMAVNTGTIANNAALVTLTLPSTSAIGDILRVTGKGAGGVRIAQNAGETIYFGTFTTTTGVGGSLTSTETRDSIELVCITANDEWNVISSIGNWTVV